MSESPITFLSEGGQVVGMVHVPDAARPLAGYPTVLFLHGFTGSKVEGHRLFVVAARALAKAGFMCLRIDFRGSGDSEGDFSDMTIRGEVADARTALSWLRAREEVDDSRIGIVGMSMGGMVTSLVVQDEPRVKSLVLWAPVGNPARLTAARLTEPRRLQMEATGLADIDGWVVGAAFVDEMMQLEPVKALLTYDRPVLVLHGTADQAVPPDEGAYYARERERAGLPVTFETIEGADHVFSSRTWTDRVVQRTVQWMTSHL